MSRYQQPCPECGCRTINPSCIACTYHPNNENENDMNDNTRSGILRDTREAREWTDNRSASEIRRDLSLLGVRVLDTEDPNTSRRFAGPVSVVIGILAVVALIVALTR